MPYTPLTEQQFNKAINSGYSPQEITAFELQRKQEIEALETPQAKKTLGSRIMGAANAVTDFVGARGIADQFGADIARAGAPQEQKNYVEYPGMKKVLGSAVQTGSLLIPGAAGAKLGAKAAMSAGGTGFKAGAANLGAKVGVGAGTGYGLDVGAGLQAGEENPYMPNAGTAIGGAIPVAGGFFNLGKSAVKKAAPNVLEFSSNVPKAAIETAMKSPDSARIGRTQMNLEQIRNRAATELEGLFGQLSKEFEEGLAKTTKVDPARIESATQAIPQLLNNYADTIAKKFRIGIADSKAGTTLDFSKSAIVKGGEQGNIRKAIETLRTWDDFSPQGMQNLAERIGELRNFDSSGISRSSAVLGKLYDKITGANGKGVMTAFYPELAAVRTDYAKNRQVLDDIRDILTDQKDNPRAVQTSVTRLNQIFNEDKETYLNVIKELSRRSGVDIVGMLAGEQFQRILPQYVRGLGGQGSAALGTAAGAYFVNPWFALLLPLFSPRAVGKLVEKGSKGSPTLRGAAQATKKVLPLVGANTTQMSPSQQQ